jgi:hypothetical protein
MPMRAIAKKGRRAVFEPPEKAIGLLYALDKAKPTVFRPLGGAVTTSRTPLSRGLNAG